MFLELTVYGAAMEDVPKLTSLKPAACIRIRRKTEKFSGSSPLRRYMARAHRRIDKDSFKRLCEPGKYNRQNSIVALDTAKVLTWFESLNTSGIHQLNLE